MTGRRSEADSVSILTGRAVRAALRGQEPEILAAVERGYLAHAADPACSPHSQFLNLPGDRRRIISLPARLGTEAAGLKWISSFPSNHDLGLERASAVIVLNSLDTGRPRWILEGSHISAARTAASAVLAAQFLGPARAQQVTLIGCGRINFEILRLLRSVREDLTSVMLFDTDAERACVFARRVARTPGGLEVRVSSGIEEALAGSPLVSFATTATTPHVATVAVCPPGSTLLHVSLRDLAPGALLEAVNVVDDADHVCRAGSSAHLAEQLTGGRGFIRATLAEVLQRGGADRSPDDRWIFHPFGLGILDIAVAQLCASRASEMGLAQTVEEFFPEAWNQDAEEDQSPREGPDMR